MKNEIGFLSGNVLKIIALITMTIDHIGYILFPNILWFRIVGRIAFPLFAFLIAEGCKYTKNKFRYFLLIFVLAGFCQIFSYLFAGQTKLNILFTFSISIALIYLLNWVKSVAKNGNTKKVIVASLLLVVCLVATYLLTSNSLKFSPISVDYGFWGIMVPFVVSLADNHYIKIALISICLVILSFGYAFVQWFCLISIPILLLYNGKRGKLKIKYLFYVYYPLHLCVLYLLKFIIK